MAQCDSGGGWWDAIRLSVRRLSDNAVNKHHKKKKSVGTHGWLDAVETVESCLWWLENSECDKEAVVWEAASNQTSSLSLSPFVLGRIPNYFLTRVHFWTEETHKQSSTVRRGIKKKTKTCYQFGICLCKTSSLLAEVERACFSYPLFFCIMAEECGSEVTRGNWLSTGSFPALA